MPDLNDNNLSEEAQRTAAIAATRQAAQTVGSAATTFKSWTLRIAGGFGIFIGLLVLFFGNLNTALIFLGFGAAGLAYGLAQNIRSWLRALGGLGIIIAGLGFLLFGIQSFQKTKASVNWPSAPASITKSATQQHTSMGHEGNNRQIITSEVAIIEYTYAVGRATFTSNQIALGEQKREDTQRLLSEYPIHKQLRAYYNPNNPRNAVLEPGVLSGNFFFLAFGIIICLIGLFYALGAFRKFLDELST
ncbi:DUF3592 domain-containing protein [bacterium]|nr:DUF3592 domain-containing protein [bacterium]